MLWIFGCINQNPKRDWSDEEIAKAIRGGISKDGRLLCPTAMPWQAYAKFSDADISAIIAYLRAIPPKSHKIPFNESPTGEEPQIQRFFVGDEGVWMFYKSVMRISEKPIQKYPCYLRPLFWSQKRKYGQVLKPGLLWARVPKLFMAVATLYGVLDRKSSLLDPILRSLVPFLCRH